MTTLIELRLGRNVGNTPMTDLNWEKMKALAATRLQSMARELCAQEEEHGNPVPAAWVETHTGVGVYEGVAEESAVVTLYITMPVLIHKEPVEGCRSYLDDRLVKIASELAKRFHQKSVAFVVGASTLIGPNKKEVQS